MPGAFAFAEIGRLPAVDDNVAIATRRLEKGTVIRYGEASFALDTTVLEGHRFAVRAIRGQAPLLSWGLPFGVAIRPIAPGQYVHNAEMLAALAEREVDFVLPPAPNFRNWMQPYVLDETGFIPGEQVPRYAGARYFGGIPRPGARGVGTRNYIIIVGSTARTAVYAQVLAQRLAPLAADFEGVDGITAVAHTEGDGQDALNNRDLVLRTLAGFIVHPNVGAVLVVDYGPEPINNDLLQAFMQQNGYDLTAVQHRFLRLAGDFEPDLERGTAVVESWLPLVNAHKRVQLPVSHLHIALQCGGSDAFSGISGNPLAGAVAREIIRYGGRANLAETDELIGAEPYMLQNVRSLAVARQFLHFIATFKERMAWHGASAEGNPSGGNRYRGLYNIALKSIGAGMKRHPAVRLDQAVDYAQPMPAPGFYFMNTPGNDLESIAGQVAGGSNLIFFVTGNGSITNFPFVPTIKIVTTTPRFEMLAREMDVNAGAYLDGRAMADLTQEVLDLSLRVASGERSKGEEAGHSQVSIWRNWRQRDRAQLPILLAAAAPSGKPLAVKDDDLLPGRYAFTAVATSSGVVSQQVGLVLPASLCAGQIARLSAERLNERGLAGLGGVSRFVALVHTEGCGVVLDPRDDLYPRTMINHMAHPMVRLGLFLEHGCEKTHNDYMRHALAARGLQAADFGWASVQLDGGMEPVMQKIQAWFGGRLETAVPPRSETADLSQVRLGLVGLDAVPPPVAAAMARVARTIVAAGGTVVVPDVASFWQAEAFGAGTIGESQRRPSLGYGQAITAPGFHIMAAPSRHWLEMITGLGATGVAVMVAWGPGWYAGHPFVPLIRVGQGVADLDLSLEGGPDRWAGAVMQRVTAVLSRQLIPKAAQQGHTGFQLTRGLLGVST